MSKLVLCIIEFIVGFVLVYLYHKIFVIKKYKDDKENGKLTSKKGKDKTPSELLLFSAMTGIDLSKVNDMKLLNVLAIVNGVDIALVLVLTELTSVFVLKLIIAFFAVFVVLIVSYRLLAKFYMRRK